MNEMTTADEVKMTVTVKVFIAILVSTITIVFTVLNSMYGIKAEFYQNLKNIENENRIQDLKYENLKLEVERNKLAIDKLRDDYRKY